jgi:ketosteroid isomerase-like protein
MKNNLLKGILLLGALTSIVACNTKKDEPVVVDKEAIKKEIQAKEDEFATVYNSGEIKSIGYYDENAITFFQNRAPLVGKAAITEFLKTDVIANSNKISFKTTEVFVSTDGNQVVETGAYSVVDSTNTTVSTGNYMSLFEKKDGKYVCVRDMSASDIPVN